MVMMIAMPDILFFPLWLILQAYLINEALHDLDRNHHDRMIDED